MESKDKNNSFLKRQKLLMNIIESRKKIIEKKKLLF